MGMEGKKTYLASALLALVGLYMQQKGFTWGSTPGDHVQGMTAMIAGGGLAALRSAVAKALAYLNDLLASVSQLRQEVQVLKTQVEAMQRAPRRIEQ